MPITLEGADEQAWAVYRSFGSPNQILSKIGDLEKDNARYRERHREDESRIRELEAVQPKDGAVVLTKEQAADWTEYLKLGKPAEVSSAVSDGAQAKAQLSARVKRDKLHEGAKALGWRAELAERIRGIDAVEIELKEMDVTDDKGNTTKARVPFVIPAGEDQKAVPLTEYVATNDPDIADLLPLRDGPDRQPKPVGGAPFVPLSDGGRPPRDEKVTSQAVRESVEKTASYAL